MATGLARAMATEWGMSDKLGPLLYGDAQDEVFLGRSMMQRNTHMSDETQRVVDSEVKRFVDEGYQTAQKVIRDNIDDLHAIAKALIEFETLTGDEIRGLMDGKMPMRESDSDTTPKASGVPSAGKSGRKKAGPAPDAPPEPAPGT
jgi:cell division protease FtsH